ncbi:MAG TPA: hypothetical protein VNJ02_18630, partial [Vicinamibacterales bacterium]|nr:hypothetical protein [Vicinamibacterales bacterium]
MAENAHQPLAGLSGLARLSQLRRAAVLILFRFQFEGNQVGEQLEDHKYVFRHLGPARIERAEGAEVRAVAPFKRDGDVTFDAVLLQTRMLAEARIGTGVVDEEGRDRARDDASISGGEIDGRPVANQSRLRPARRRPSTSLPSRAPPARSASPLSGAA